MGAENLGAAVRGSSTTGRIAVAVGLFMIIAALLISSTMIESALSTEAVRPLAWGPTLFRVLLGFHGAMLIAVALTSASFESVSTKATSPFDGLRANGKSPLQSKHTPFAPASLTARASEGEHRDAWAWVLLTALMVLALGLRLWQLDSGMWIDEVTTLIAYARSPFGEIVSRFESQNNHVLYSIVAHASLLLFGENVSALRLPAVLFGVASVWALFVLARRRTDTRAALLACALMAVSYHHIWFSQSARGYTGILFFATVTTWLWIEARERQGGRWWGAYVVAVALGSWMHMTMVFVVVSHVVIDAFAWALGRVEFTWKPVVAWLLCVTGTLQLYALSLPEFLSVALHQVSAPSEWTSPAWALAESLRGLRIGYASTGVVAVGGVLTVLGWLELARRMPAAATAMILPALLGGAAMVVLGHNIWPRFFFFSMGFVLLLVVHGAMSASRLLVGQKPAADLVAASLVGVAIVASATTIPRAYLPKQAFGEARDYVEEHRGSEDGVVAVGLAGSVYGRYYAPQWAVAQSAHELEAARRGHSTNWLVYTLPTQLKTFRADVWRVVEDEFNVVKVFPGTLSGGQVYVCRSAKQ